LRERPRDQHLLLIAAGKRSDQVILASHPYREPAGFPLEYGLQLAAIDQVEPSAKPVILIDREQQVLKDAQVCKNPFLLSIAGNVGHRIGVRRMQVVHVVAAGPVEDADATGRKALDTGEATHEVALALSVQAGDSDDLARIEREVDLAGIVPYAGALDAQDRCVAEPFGDGLRRQGSAALRSGDQLEYAGLGDLFLLQ